MLTGQYAAPHRRPGQRPRRQAGRVGDDRRRLHDAGYHTGLVGKYLNQYPFGRPEYVPLGWDVVTQGATGRSPSLYYGYTLIEDRGPCRTATRPATTGPTCSASKAVEFIREAPFGAAVLPVVRADGAAPAVDACRRGTWARTPVCRSAALVHRRGRRLRQAGVGAGAARARRGVPGGDARERTGVRTRRFRAWTRRSGRSSPRPLPWGPQGHRGDLHVGQRVWRSASIGGTGRRARTRSASGCRS